MKKEIVFSIALISLIFLAIPVIAESYYTYSVEGKIAVGGNCSSTNYWREYLGVAQLNSSVKSSEEIFFQSKFNISSNSTTVNVDYICKNQLNSQL